MVMFKPLLCDHDLLCCDNLMGGVNTYVNLELGHESCIDHVFVAYNLPNDISSIQVIDWGHNASDKESIPGLPFPGCAGFLLLRVAAAECSSNQD